MGAETKKLAQVSYVTDTDVSYYEESVKSYFDIQNSIQENNS